MHGAGLRQRPDGARRRPRRPGTGLDVPADLSVVGFDDSQLVAFTDPPLTTVRQPVHAMATAAVGALLEEIAHQTVQRTEFVFQPELVVRGSTAQWVPGDGADVRGASA